MAAKAAEDAWARLLETTAAETARRSPKGVMMQSEDLARQRWLAAGKLCVLRRLPGQQALNWGP